MPGIFKVSKISNFKAFKEGDILNESDFSVLTADDNFIQFNFENVEKQDSRIVEVEPGLWTIAIEKQRMVLRPTDFSKQSLLEDYVTTKDVEDRIDTFFNKLEVYKKLGIDPRRGVLLYGPAGCHAKGTGILMFDGSVKLVEDVVVGDLLMGPDSKPRTVLALARGEEEMVEITPIKGDPFIVNKSHILHLHPSGKNETIKCAINIKFSDYQSSFTQPMKEKLKLKRVGVDFKEKQLEIDPYILGLWLGDGSSNGASLTTIDPEIRAVWIEYGKKLGLNFTEYNKTKTKATTITLSNNWKGNPFLDFLRKNDLLNNKHIPADFLINSRQNRLSLLAGLLDSDGYAMKHKVTSKSKGGYGYEISSKIERLSNEIVFLARSLGFAAYSKKENKNCYIGKKIVFTGEYFRVSISGEVSEIPVILPRKKCNKRLQIKDILRTGFSYKILPKDSFYGFSLDGDHLYLTSDFTIHHNTGKSSIISKIAQKYATFSDTAIVLWPSDKFEARDVKDFLGQFNYEKHNIKKMMLIIEDLGGVEQNSGPRYSEASLLSLLDNVERTFTVPTAIIATTNFPEMFLENLTNRPQRFDDVIEVKRPEAAARSKFLEFFSQLSLTEAQKSKIEQKKYDIFSVAHLKEVVIRSMLYDISLEESMDRIYEQADKASKSFSNKKGMGIGNDYF